MIEIGDNSLGDALSEVAKYCPDSESHLELIDTIVHEVDLGGVAFGIFGSQAREQSIEGSDTDLFVLNKKACFIPRIYDRLPVHEFQGTPKTLNKDGLRPWIDTLRIPPQQLLPFVLHSFDNWRILSTVKFLWHDPSFDMNIIGEAVKKGEVRHLPLSVDDLFDRELSITQDMLSTIELKSV